MFAKRDEVVSLGEGYGVRELSIFTLMYQEREREGERERKKKREKGE